IASGRWMISAVPSACTHSPKNWSFITHSDARGSRIRFLVLTAVSRVLLTTRPTSTTPTVTGESCGSPSDRVVASTARWWARMNSRARSRSIGTSSAVKANAALHFVLVHDSYGVRVRQPVLVGQPRRALAQPHEGGSRLQPVEPLSEIAAGDSWNASYQVLVHLRGVSQGQGAPPCRDSPTGEPALPDARWQDLNVTLPLLG